MVADETNCGRGRNYPQRNTRTQKEENIAFYSTIGAVLSFSFSVFYYYYEYVYQNKKYNERMKYFRNIGLEVYLNDDFDKAVPMFGDMIRVGDLCIYGRKTRIILRFTDIDEILRWEDKTIEKGASGSRLVKSVAFYIKFRSNGRTQTLCKLAGAYDEQWRTFVELLRQKNRYIKAADDMDISVRYVEEEPKGSRPMMDHTVE